MAQPFATDQITDSLQNGLQQMHLNLSAQVVSAMVNFLAELERWNKAYNLTAVRDPTQMVTKHLLDSLAIAPHLRGQRLIDVGTGSTIGWDMPSTDPEERQRVLVYTGTGP